MFLIRKQPFVNWCLLLLFVGFTAGIVSDLPNLSACDGKSMKLRWMVNGSPFTSVEWYFGGLTGTIIMTMDNNISTPIPSYSSRLSYINEANSVGMKLASFSSADQGKYAVNVLSSTFHDDESTITIDPSCPVADSTKTYITISGNNLYPGNSISVQVTPGTNVEIKVTMDMMASFYKRIFIDGVMQSSCAPYGVSCDLSLPPTIGDKQIKVSYDVGDTDYTFMVKFEGPSPLFTGLSPGEIAGIVIGCLIVVAIVVGVTVACVRSRKQPPPPDFCRPDLDTYDPALCKYSSGYRAYPMAGMGSEHPVAGMGSEYPVAGMGSGYPVAGMGNVYYGSPAVTDVRNQGPHTSRVMLVYNPSSGYYQ